MSHFATLTDTHELSEAAKYIEWPKWKLEEVCLLEKSDYLF